MRRGFIGTNPDWSPPELPHEPLGQGRTRFDPRWLPTYEPPFLESSVIRYSQLNFESGIYPIAIRLSKNRLLIFVEDIINVFDLSTHRLLRHIILGLPDQAVRFVAPLPDGNVMIAFMSGELAFFDPYAYRVDLFDENQQPLHIVAHTVWPHGVALICSDLDTKATFILTYRASDESPIRVTLPWTWSDFGDVWTDGPHIHLVRLFPVPGLDRLHEIRASLLRGDVPRDTQHLYVNVEEVRDEIPLEWLDETISEAEKLRPIGRWIGADKEALVRQLGEGENQVLIYPEGVVTLTGISDTWFGWARVQGDWAVGVVPDGAPPYFGLGNPGSLLRGWHLTDSEPKWEIRTDNFVDDFDIWDDWLIVTTLHGVADEGNPPPQRIAVYDLVYGDRLL